MLFYTDIDGFAKNRFIFIHKYRNLLCLAGLNRDLYVDHYNNLRAWMISEICND